MQVKEPTASVVVASLPNRLEFGGQPIQSDEVKSLLVRNRGSSNLNVRFVGIAAEDAGDFRLADTTCQGAPTPPGETCRIRAVFRPTGLAQRTAKLIIADDAADSPQSVTLIGTGLAPLEAPEPKLPPKSSTWKPVELHNTGEATVTVRELFLPHDNNNFKLDPRQCLDKPIPGGESCQVTVQYTPSFAPSDGTSCTPELVLRNNMGDAPDNKGGELVAKVCEDTDESTGEAEQKKACQYTGISFTGTCVRKDKDLARR